MLTKAIPEPWLTFLQEIDRSLQFEATFHCFGGFAIELMFGLPRETSDVDVVGEIVSDRFEELNSIAGKGSELHGKHNIYLDLVGTIAVIPDDYKERLIPLRTEVLKRIRLFVMEPHDIILAKLGRDAPKDVQDAMHIARVFSIDTELLRARYEAELRPYVIGPPEREDGKLNYWISMIDEIRSSQ